MAYQFQYDIRRVNYL